VYDPSLLKFPCASFRAVDYYRHTYLESPVAVGAIYWLFVLCPYTCSISVLEMRITLRQMRREAIDAFCCRELALVALFVRIELIAL
jgi:hypothetical protein